MVDKLNYKKMSDDELVQLHSAKLKSEAANTEMMRRLKNEIKNSKKQLSKDTKENTRAIKMSDLSTELYSLALLFLTIVIVFATYFPDVPAHFVLGISAITIFFIVLVFYNIKKNVDIKS